MNLQRIPRCLLLGLVASTLVACDFGRDEGMDDAGDDGDSEHGSSGDGEASEGGGWSSYGGSESGGGEASDGEASDGGEPGDGGGVCNESPPAPDPAVMDGLVPYEGPGVITDCDVGGGYQVSSWRATSVDPTRLWVGGVYQTRGDHGGGAHPVGDGSVSWSEPGSNVLVVSSYEPTHWTIEVQPGGELERVVAIGYHVQTVDAPPGVVVETHAYEAGDCLYSCGFALPGQGEGCEGEELVAAAEYVTGLSLYAFDGCYDATSFTYAP